MSAMDLKKLSESELRQLARGDLQRPARRELRAREEEMARRERQREEQHQAGREREFLRGLAVDRLEDVAEASGLSGPPYSEPQQALVDALNAGPFDDIPQLQEAAATELERRREERDRRRRAAAQRNQQQASPSGSLWDVFFPD